jgi:transcriptional regulator with XRE-family HTH domain
MSELSRSIGSAARAARKTLGLTQEDVAERINVSAEFYARIERGGALPSVPTLVRISNALGVSADVMLGRVPGAGTSKPTLPDVSPPSVENPEVRKLLRRLRKASSSTVRLVSLVLKAMQE